MTTAHSLGRTLRDVRRKKGWTQADLAERTGVTQATISNLERGEANPTLATVLGIAAALDIELILRVQSGPATPAPWDREDG